MNPKFTKVTLNSFIFVLNIFCTNLAKKFGMINITHEVTFCLLQYEYVSEIQYVNSKYSLLVEQD